LVFNGFYSPFGISGHFWASQNPLIFLQYPPFSNLHMCLNPWNVRSTIVVWGSVMVKATLCLISGGKESRSLFHNLLEISGLSISKNGQNTPIKGVHIKPKLAKEEFRPFLTIFSNRLVQAVLADATP